MAYYSRRLQRVIYRGNLTLRLGTNRTDRRLLTLACQSASLWDLEQSCEQSSKNYPREKILWTTVHSYAVYGKQTCGSDPVITNRVPHTLPAG